MGEWSERAEICDALAVIQMKSAETMKTGQRAEILEFFTDGEVKILQPAESGERLEVA